MCVCVCVGEIFSSSLGSVVLGSGQRWSDSFLAWTMRHYDLMFSWLCQAAAFFNQEAVYVKKVFSMTGAGACLCLSRLSS